MAGQSPPRGEALAANRWYIPPVAIPDDQGRNPIQAQQGDLYKRVPSVIVESRPLRVARDFQPGHGGRTKYTALSEDDDPEQPFDWEKGENVVVRGRIAPGILLTQDCEIDKPRATFLFAEVRSVAGIPQEDVEVLRRRQKYRAFFLEGQGEMPHSFVDFGRLTTIDAGALREADRWLSLTEVIRSALREDFAEFLANDRGDPRETA